MLPQLISVSVTNKRQQSGEHLELLFLRNMRNNRQGWNVLHVPPYSSSCKCCSSLISEAAALLNQLKRMYSWCFALRQVTQRQKLAVMTYKTAMSNALMRQLQSSGLAACQLCNTGLQRLREAPHGFNLAPLDSNGVLITLCCTCCRSRFSSIHHISTCGGKKSCVASNTTAC